MIRLLSGPRMILLLVTLCAACALTGCDNKAQATSKPATESMTPEQKAEYEQKMRERMQGGGATGPGGGMPGGASRMPGGPGAPGMPR